MLNRPDRPIVVLATVLVPAFPLPHELLGDFSVCFDVPTVNRDYADSTPLLRFVKGHLTGLNVVEFVRAMSPLKTLDLELQDARHAQIILQNPDGDFDVTGPISPTPAKGE